jgi:hypothetical protein
MNGGREGIIVVRFARRRGVREWDITLHRDGWVVELGKLRLDVWM